MAKKTVAGYRDKSKIKSFTKVLRAIKNPETGAYTFKQDIIPSDEVKNFLRENK